MYSPAVCAPGDDSVGPPSKWQTHERTVSPDVRREHDTADTNASEF